MNLARIRVERDSAGVWLWEVILPSGELYEMGSEPEPLDAMTVALDSELDAAGASLCQLPHAPVVHQESQSNREVNHE